MTRPIKFTLEQGNHFFRETRQVGFPAKVGSREFSSDERVTFQHELQQLAKKLREYSPLYKTQRKLVFGPEDGWRLLDPVKPDGPVVPIDPDRTIEIPLNRKCRNAIYRLCYLWLHPESQGLLPPWQAEEMVWPIIEQLGNEAVNQMEKDIGLTNAKTWEVPVGEECDEVLVR